MFNFLKNQNNENDSFLKLLFSGRHRWRDSGKRSIYGDYKILEYTDENGKTLEDYDDLF